MSRHHRAQKWSTHAPKIRAQLTALLPLPCVDCGHLVTREHKWQVGHRTAASKGGTPTLANAGPSHQRSEAWPRNCNQISGGKLGAAVTNRARQAGKDIRPW